MRLVGNALRDELAAAWERWGHRCADLTATQWHNTTRCEARDVQSLVAHVCPEATTFGELADAVGGVAPSDRALAASRDLLIAVPDPAAAVEALAGRIPARAAVPAIR